MPSVLIVDDEDDIRFIIRWMIEEASGAWYVAGEATSAEEAVARWRELRPDFVIIDHLLQGPSGLEAAERILAQEPRQRIVLLSMIGDEEVNRAAVALGVTLCVSKAKLQDLPTILAGLWRDTPGELPG
jgi:DNA-binding NarL/FixJ family response regulator